MQFRLEEMEIIELAKPMVKHKMSKDLVEKLEIVDLFDLVVLRIFQSNLNPLGDMRGMSLIDAFEWGATPEGHNFWASIDMILDEQEFKYGYKLVRKTKTGLAPLFIDRTFRMPTDTWMTAKFVPTKGYKQRKGWHCTLKPEAPHLTEKNRVWVKVKMFGVKCLSRPESQGGKWALADYIKIIEVL